ncbi:MAG: hypothetical protein M3464_10310 [Chloroflexota bacterium]|nr:hypothetical protein [Chloroflexota bacterium]
MSDHTIDDAAPEDVQSSFSGKSTGGEPRVIVLTGEQALKAQAADNRHELSLTRLRHQNDEGRMRNELRRHQEQITFYVVVCMIALGLVVGSFIATQAEDADT